MDARTFRQTPRYLLLITANALPVYGALTGKIVFFQVLWLYWLESLLVVGFDLIRVLCAGGTGAGPGADAGVAEALRAIGDPGPLRIWTRIGIAFRNGIVRILILACYLLFLIIFVGLQVTDDSHAGAVGRSIAFRDAFVNTALVIFIINGFVQLIAGFFLNGLYRVISPRMFVDIVSPRTIVMHVMIVSSVCMHAFLFKDGFHAGRGESIYVGIFMLIRTVLDIRSMRRRADGNEAPVVMI